VSDSDELLAALVEERFPARLIAAERFTLVRPSDVRDREARAAARRRAAVASSGRQGSGGTGRPPADSVASQTHTAARAS
jgi:hypothetical protein